VRVRGRVLKRFQENNEKPMKEMRKIARGARNHSQNALPFPGPFGGAAGGGPDSSAGATGTEAASPDGASDSGTA